MPGVLDLVLKPGDDPVDDKSFAIYRDDPFSQSLEFKDEAGEPIDMSGSYTAEIRKLRLPGDTPAPDTPLAVFDVDTSDAATGTLVINLTRDQTRDLNLAASETAVWDIQDDTTGVTWVTGKVKIVDDVSRPV